MQNFQSVHDVARTTLVRSADLAGASTSTYPQHKYTVIPLSNTSLVITDKLITYYMFEYTFIYMTSMYM